MDYNSLCNALNEFHLPRAIGHLDQDRFVAWNDIFLSESGLSREEVQRSRLKELATFDERTTNTAPGYEQTGFTLIPFQLKCPDAARVLRGNAAKKDDGFVLLIVAPPETPELRESAWKQGRDDEHERILKLFHDDVSPKLLAAVFAAQVAKEELEASGLPAESTTVAKIGDQLVEAIEGVADALEPEEAKKIPD
jgi:hypothetical protein